MEEAGQDFIPRRIVKRQNARGVVPMKSPSRTSGLASKAIATAAVAGLLVGGAKLIDSATSVEAASDQAHVAIITPPQPEVSQASLDHAPVTAPGYFDEIFHDLTPEEKQKAQEEVQKFKDRILAKQDYQKEHLQVPFEYKEIIEQTAHTYGISVDSLMGLIGTENGGGADKINPSSGARGVAQFMPDTAQEYKLKISDKEKIDQRADPVLSIDAAGRYLRDKKALFAGDEGMALWSYHAGPGNVYHALRIYFYDVNHENINDYGAAIANNNPDSRGKIEQRTKELIIQDNLDISKLLANPKVMEFTATLHDYSDTYPATVVAMSQIINDHLGQAPVHDLGGGLKVSLASTPTATPVLRTQKP